MVGMKKLVAGFGLWGMVAICPVAFGQGKVGENIPGPFHPLVLNGELADRYHCFQNYIRIAAKKFLLLPAIPHSPKAHQAPNPRSSKADKTPHTKPKSTHLGQTARGFPIPNRLAAFPHGASKPKTVKSPNVKMGKICRFSNYLDLRASQELHRCLKGKGNRRLGQASPSLGGSNPNTVIQAKFITSKKHFAGLRMNEVQATALSAGLIAEML